MYTIWHQMLKIVSASGAPPGPRWGSYGALRTPIVVINASCLRVTRNRSFRSSTLVVTSTRKY